MMNNEIQQKAESIYSDVINAVKNKETILHSDISDEVKKHTQEHVENVTEAIVRRAMREGTFGQNYDLNYFVEKIKGLWARIWKA